jgi:hypothetical protein
LARWCSPFSLWEKVGMRALKPKKYAGYKALTLALSQRERGL